MKKVLPILIATALLLTLAAVFVGCDKGDAHTEHTFGEWTVTEAATCLKAGKRTHTCTVCGEVEEETIAMLAHTPKVEIAGKPATCTEDGMSDKLVCEECSTVLQEQVTIAALGHDYGDPVYIEDGEGHKHKRICKRDGEHVLVEDCSSLNDVVVAATCEDDGYTLHTCDECGNEYKDTIIQAKGHSYGAPQYIEGGVKHQHQRVCANDPTHRIVSDCVSENDVVTAPTCTLQGFTHHVCEACNHAYDDDFKDPTGHTYGEWVVDKQPTCDETGLKHQDCIHGDSKQEEVIDKREHNWSGWDCKQAPTCTSVGIDMRECLYDDCDATEEKEVNMLSHDHYDWQVTIEATCTSVGSKERHCKNCDHVDTAEIPMTDHTPEIIPRQEPTCEGTGATQGTKCKVCQTILQMPAELAPAGHKLESGYHILAGQHKHYQDCTVCFKRFESDCIVTTDRIQPTCEDVGYTRYTCVHCGDQYTGDETAALGHKLGDPKSTISTETTGDHTHTHVSKCLRSGCEYSVEEPCTLLPAGSVAATCTMPGYDKTECEKCHAVHEEITAEPLKHDIRYYWIRDSYPYKHYQQCMRPECGYRSAPENCPMQYVTTLPTCTEQGETRGTCEYCQRSVRRGYATPALGHSYGQWVFDEGSEPHTHTKTCERQDCNDKVTASCSEVTDVMRATCDEIGGTHTYCTECLNVVGETIEQALGHAYGNWINDEKTGDHYKVCQNNPQHIERAPHEEIVNEIPASCTVQGMIVTTCASCDYRVEVPTTDPAMGHQFEVKEVTAQGHKVECMLCHEEWEGDHDWADTNLCRYCEYDALVYVNMGAHYIVDNDSLLEIAKTKKVIIKAYHSELGSDAQLPVLEIKRSAFSRNNYIVEVELPATLTTIDDHAFASCFNLRTVTIDGDDAGALAEIGEYAFNTCMALESFEAPMSLRSIGDFAFAGCTKLDNIKIHDEIESVGRSAFDRTKFIEDTSNWDSNLFYIGKHLIKGKVTVVEEGVYADTDVVLHDDTIAINESAFEGLPITSIVIPTSLKLVEVNAFKDCTSLKKVEFKGDMAQWFEIDFRNEYSSPLCYDSSLHIDAAHDRIVIPETVTRIPAGTFRGTAITEVILPQSVTFIGAEAFEDCDQLAKIQLPDTITYIGRDAFNNSLYFNTPANWTDDNALYINNHLIATKAENVGAEFVVRNNTKTIGIEAFKDCEQLTKVTIADSVVRIGAGVFNGCTQLADVVFVNTEADWFAEGVIGRTVDGQKQLADSKSARQMFIVYYGEWRILSPAA